MKAHHAILMLSLVLQHALCRDRLAPRHGEVDVAPDSGCVEGYNFKHPHPCKPNEDCKFVVKWRTLQKSTEDNPGMAEFEVMATLPQDHSQESVWVALGFSFDSKMGNDDVITCWHKNNEFSIHNGHNKPDDHMFVMDKDTSYQGDSADEVVLNHNHTRITDGTFHCKFQRKLVIRDPTENKNLTEPLFVLAAAGPLRDVSDSGEEVPMQQHFMRIASTCACLVTDCGETCSCPGGFFYQLLKLHGIVMSFCFMFLIPTGALTSRYYKVVFVNSWFKAHVTLMAIGVLWSLVGLGLVLAHTHLVFSVGFHQLLGLTCLVLGVVQPAVAFFRPANKPNRQRLIFNIFHRSTAISILGISAVVLFLGAHLFHNAVVNYMYAVLVLYLCLNIGFIVALEIFKYTRKFSSSPPVGYHKVTRQEDEGSDSEEEVYVKEEQEKKTKGPLFKFEKGLFLLFVVQNLILSILFNSFIFYFDAD